MTTVRYQNIWQSGYTYRWLKVQPQHTTPYMEFIVHPKDAAAAGLAAGDWAELSNQYSKTQGVVNVSDEVPPGSCPRCSAGKARTTAAPPASPRTTPTT